MVLKIPDDSLQKVESEFTKIIDSDMGRDKKFREFLSLMSEGHAETQSIMKEGFVGLAIQNAELNAELKEQNKVLQKIRKSSWMLCVFLFNFMLKFAVFLWL